MEKNASRSVLLAIEHRPSADLLGDRLRRNQLDIIQVEEGHQALEEIQSGKHGVVVVQARLPGRTGLELLRETTFLQPPLVVLGRRGNDDEVVRALELGAADYITRPFSPRVATARIRRCFRLRPDSDGATHSSRT